MADVVCGWHALKFVAVKFPSGRCQRKPLCPRQIKRHKWLHDRVGRGWGTWHRGGEGAWRVGEWDDGKHETRSFEVSSSSKWVPWQLIKLWWGGGEGGDGGGGCLVVSYIALLLRVFLPAEVCSRRAKAMYKVTLSYRIQNSFTKIEIMVFLVEEVWISLEKNTMKSYFWWTDSWSHVL